MLKVSKSWKQTYPGAVVGILAMNQVANPTRHPALEGHKAVLERSLRERYVGLDRPALRALPVLQAYHNYYKRFKKSYHLQLQLESVVLQDKPIPRGVALVEAMFMAELQDLLLTAGHDLERVEQPVRLDIAQGTEQFTRINGQSQTLKAGDMYIADDRNVISSIIYGPDQRTRIRPETQAVLFTSYAPPGIGREAVRQHLGHIQELVLLIAPAAQTTALQMYSAD